MQDIIDKLSPDLVQKFKNMDFEGLIKLELQDESPMHCYILLNGEIELKEDPAPAKHPDMIIRGQSSDLAALLSGKMSFADGFVSERISLVGDLVKINTYKHAVQKALS